MATLWIDHEHPIWCTDDIVEIDREIKALKEKIERSVGVKLECVERTGLVALWSDDANVCEWCQYWMLVKSHVRR